MSEEEGKPAGPETLESVIAELKKLNPKETDEYWAHYRKELIRIQKLAKEKNQSVGIDHHLICYFDGSFSFYSPCIKFY